MFAMDQPQLYSSIVLPLGQPSHHDTFVHFVVVGESSLWYYRWEESCIRHHGWHHCRTTCTVIGSDGTLCREGGATIKFGMRRRRRRLWNHDHQGGSHEYTTATHKPKKAVTDTFAPPFGFFAVAPILLSALRGAGPILASLLLLDHPHRVSSTTRIIAIHVCADRGGTKHKIKEVEKIPWRRGACCWCVCVRVCVEGNHNHSQTNRNLPVPKLLSTAAGWGGGGVGLLSLARIIIL
jgi:hypothetical protein